MGRRKKESEKTKGKNTNETFDIVKVEFSVLKIKMKESEG